MSTDPQSPSYSDDRTLRRVLACFAIIAAVLVGVVVVSLRNLNRAIATSDWVNHTHALITEVDALQPALLAAEGELNRFLLTADPRDHSAYQDKFADLGERVDVVAALIADNAAEREQFAAISATLARRAERASRELDRLTPVPPAVRLFDAGMGDGTVLSRMMRSTHQRYPRFPLYVAGKEISLEDVRLTLEKMPDRLVIDDRRRAAAARRAS